MPKVLEKVERRLGEKLFLKGERCVGPKCALTRRSYPPGVHGRGRGKHRRGLSEYGQLLREKQKIRFLYGLDDKALLRYSKEAARRPGIFSSNFVRLLESRLDNVIFRLGFVASRRMARQIISHGHVTVNGKTVNVPSYAVRRNDSTALKESSLSSPLFSELERHIKKYEPPFWLELDKEKKTGKIIGIPEVDFTTLGADITKIKEFYSR